MPRPEDIERLCDVWFGSAPRGAVASAFLAELLPALRQTLNARGVAIALRDGSSLIACGDLLISGSAELADGEDETLTRREGMVVRRSRGKDRQRFTALFLYPQADFSDDLLPGIDAAVGSLERAIARLVQQHERRFGDFEIVARLDEGGMAEIHLARMADAPDELVALKRIKSHLAAEEGFLRMFLSEVRTAQQVRHENVVRILEYGVEAKRPYLAMEYLRGASLAKLTRRAAAASVPLGAQLLTALLRGFCHGLHAVHEKGIVHCDVSPQNLLVTFDGRAKVIDFGVARAVGNRMAQEDGPLRGKLGYLAPEQLAGETLDRRCDVFALGVVAYELLAGQEPGSVRESIRRYTPGGFPALVEVNPRVPGPLAEAVGRAVMIDPAARLPSCEAFSEALEKALEKCRLAAAEPADVAALMRDLFGDHEAALKRLLAGPQGTDTGDKVKTFRLDGE